MRAAKRDFQEVESANDDDDFAPDGSEEVSRPVRKSRRVESVDESSAGQPETAEHDDNAGKDEGSENVAEPAPAEPMDVESETAIRPAENGSNEGPEAVSEAVASLTTEQAIIA